MKTLAITSMFGFVIAVASAFGLMPSMDRTASCAECDVDNPAGIRKAFVAFGEQCKKHLAGGTEAKTCFDSSVYNKVVPLMKALGKDNRFGPGDRIFIIGETRTGALAGTNRVYQTAAPVDKDSVTVKVTRIEGGTAALVKICAVSEDGSVRSVGTIDLAKNIEASERSTTVSGVRGKILRVDISGSGGVATKKFQYRLAAN